MNFLAPLFLLGALAVALPVIFHLIRRKVKDRMRFSSLMFLQPSPPRLTRRSRLEHFLLLALRCAVLCLLAAGFARPFLKRASPPAQASPSAKRSLVLIDTSASMRRQELWDAAFARADALARQAGPADTMAFFTFDRQLTPIVTFDEWDETASARRSTLVRSRLGDTRPGWSGTAIGNALIQAAEMFDNAKEPFAGTKQIILVSDFQEGGRLSTLQGHQWPKEVKVIPERIVPRPSSNAGLQLATDLSSTAPTPESAVRLRVSNAAHSKAEQFRIAWAAPAAVQPAKAVEVYVPPGQSRVVALQLPPTNSASDRVILSGDDEPFDNTVWVIPPGKTQVTVVYLGREADSDVRQPLFFLKQALQDTPRQVIRVVTPDLSAPLNPADIQAASLFVVTAGLDPSQLNTIKSAVDQGKTLLLAPASAEAADGLATIIDAGLPPAREHNAQGYAMLAEIDFADPLFAPFADSRFSDFTKLHFWKYRAMDFSQVRDARVLARFDTGDPAIVSIPCGKGRVLILTSGWHPADSQLALSSKFVPLLYSVVDLSGAPAPSAAQYYVGAALPVAADPAGGATLKVRTPGGSETVLGAGETNFTALEPGIYSSGSMRFAVNLEPTESRTAPVPADELDRLGVPGPAAVPPPAVDVQRNVRLHNTELEANQKLWRWLILGALAVVGFETWLAGRTARRAALTEEAS